ncbi:MAG: hypothetical protein AB1414_20175 [bacterium]
MFIFQMSIFRVVSIVHSNLEKIRMKGHNRIGGSQRCPFNTLSRYNY